MSRLSEEPDLTIHKLQEVLREERGVTAGVGTIWAFLDRAAQTFKNVWAAPSASDFIESAE